ncbi:ABC transporter ATP-binding protein/permease [Streptomyces sp. NBC_00090]|uniref:ABC transporter ATP-binding protein n=1 Tax=Streptomyces sp. NBC_00090 TaxID=2903619 RepID=UPI003246B429
MAAVGQKQADERQQAEAPRQAEARQQGWARRLAGYAWRYKANVVLALGSSLVGMAVLALVPLVTKVIIDDVIGTKTRDLGVWTGFLLGAAVLVYALTYVRRYYGGRLALDVQHDLRTDMFGAITRLDGRRQDELSTGQVVGRATSDLQLIQGLLFMLPMTIGNVLLFLISLAVMAWLSLPLTLVALAVAPALWFIAKRSRTRLHPATWHAQQQAAAVAGVVDGAVTGVRVVKGFGQEDQEIGKIREAGRKLFAGRLRTIRLNAKYTPALQAVPALGQVAVLALGGWLAYRGQITLGTFVAFSAYLASLVGPVRMLAMVLTVGQQARAGVDRVLDLVDTEPVIQDGTKELPADAPATVEFDDVGFSYQGASGKTRPVLDGFSLEIRSGETVALVGSSGSGKSTVSLLLPRFYDVDHGAVLVGGHDVRELTLDSLRAAVGLVPEDSFLFSDTVRANIAYGVPDATQEQIEAAARAARADRFIDELPHGYDTKVGEHGLTLSGGQRQRVALARAILTDPRLLLLDDATSAVDAKVEHEIHEALKSVMAGRTTLLIAHRRSTLGLADRIAVLDDGRLSDIGTHEELEERSPLYRRLLTDPDALGAVSPGHVTPTELPEDATLRAELDAEFDAERGITPALWGRDGRETEESPAPGATPELIAAVEALPPATDIPGIDEARAVSPEDTGNTARAVGAGGGLRRLLRGFGVPLLISLGLVALDAGAGLLLPVLIRHGIDEGVNRLAIGAVWAASALALVTVLVQWVAQTAETRMTGRTGERVLYTLRLKIFAQLQRLGLDYYERELTGRIMTRMTTDVDALSTFLQTGLVTAFVSVVTFFGIMVALLFLDLQLALVVFATLPVLAVATYYFRRSSVKAYELARDRISVVNADLQESVVGLRIVQAFRREHSGADRFAARSAEYREARVRGQWLISIYFPFVTLLSSAAAAAVMIVGANRIEAGSLTTGALVAYLLYIDLFFAPVQQLSQVFDGYQQASVSLKRVQELLQEPTSTAAADEPRDVRSLRGEIAFEDVSFAYGTTDVRDGEDAALTGIDLRIPAGQTVAFVGETGAGKSTLVKLVARFYDPTAGRVTADGTDLRDLDLTAYRHRLGVVPQEAYLFAGTVRDAIAYGRPGATDAEVEAAARAVGAHDMIATLDGGYLHEVAERGRNLSAGQRQLVALARAELVDPDVLLLDEATAALDLATEAQVNQATDRIAGRRTTLVVAHRLTTAARADRVVLMDHGRVAEDGTHEELLALGGRYAALWSTFIGEAEAEPERV